MSVVTIVVMSKNVPQDKLTEAVKRTVSESAMRKRIGPVDGQAPDVEIDVRPEDDYTLPEPMHGERRWGFLAEPKEDT